MEYNENIHLAIALLLSVLAAYFAIYIAPADVEMGELVQVLYFHLPSAISTYLTILISMASGIIFLMNKQIKLDALSESAALLGITYGFITLVSGSIWGNATWGVYWNWDPRETTTLILWLAYIGYFLLRMSVENPERRATVSAAYNVLSFLTVPLSYLSFILWPSLHPKLTSGEGIGLTGTMTQALIMNIVAGLILYLWLLKKAYDIRLKKDQLDLKIIEEAYNAS